MISCLCLSPLWLAVCVCITSLIGCLCTYLLSDWLEGRWWRTQGQTSPWPSDSSARRQCSSLTTVASLRSSVTFSISPVFLPVCLSVSPDFIIIQFKSKCCNIFVKLPNQHLLNCHYGVSRDLDVFSLSLSLCRRRGLFMTCRPTSCSLIGRGCTCSGWAGGQDNVSSLLHSASLPQTYLFSWSRLYFLWFDCLVDFPDSKAMMRRIDSNGWRVSSWHCDRWPMSRQTRSA